MSKQPSFSTIILAAGRGTRMRSKLPKVLHCLGGKSLLSHVLTTVFKLKPEQVLTVVGFGHEQVEENVRDFLFNNDETDLQALSSQTESSEHFAENLATSKQLRVDFVHQEQQLGTGDAVKQAVTQLLAVDRVLILNGDAPFISAESIANLLNNTPIDALGMLTAVVPDPFGLGRIIRDENANVVAIVEEKDATLEQCALDEINPGVYVISKSKLEKWLPKLTTKNAQKELYITDVVTQAILDGVDIHAEAVVDPIEVQGINNRAELAKMEREYQLRKAKDLMLQGVTIVDPARFDVRGEVEIAADAFIDVNVVIEGQVTLEEDVVIGPNVCLKNCVIGKGTKILANSIVEDTVIGSNCQVGPFARTRPGTELKDKVKIGNFVEVKNSVVGTASKANHLSYIGDAEIGNKVNIGAGTITCNYDGANKYKTIIQDEVFVGSNTELIAPVIVGKGATIAAGTTVIKDVPEGKLVLNQKQTKVVSEWERPTKGEKNK